MLASINAAIRQVAGMTAHGHAAEPPPLEQGDATGDAAYPEVPERFLTDAQLQEFLETGVLVVPDVLTPEEVAAARQGLHDELAKYGVVRGMTVDSVAMDVFI